MNMSNLPVYFWRYFIINDFASGIVSAAQNKIRDIPAPIKTT